MQRFLWKLCFLLPWHRHPPPVGYRPDSGISPYHYQPLLFGFECCMASFSTASLCAVYPQASFLKLAICALKLLLKKTKIIFSLIVTANLYFGKWFENAFWPLIRYLVLLSYKQSASYTCLPSIWPLMTMPALLAVLFLLCGAHSGILSLMIHHSFPPTCFNTHHLYFTFSQRKSHSNLVFSFFFIFVSLHYYWSL